MSLPRLALRSAPGLFAALGLALLSWPPVDATAAASARVPGAPGAARVASAASAASAPYRPMSEPAPMPLPSPMPPASAPDPTARAAPPALLPALPRASAPIVAPLHLRSASMSGRECQARRNAHPAVAGRIAPVGPGTPMAADGPCGDAPPVPSIAK